MEIKRIPTLLIFSCFFFSSCKKEAPPAEYYNYVQDKKNGLKKTMNIDGWEYEFMYRPADYIILMESKGNISGNKLQSRREQLEGTLWFSIAFKRADNSITPLKYEITSQGEYDKRLDYYLNGAINDIKLVYGNDTLVPQSYVFENNFNLTPQQTMLAGFIISGKDKLPVKDMQLIYYERIFKNGIIKTSFSSKAINNLPTLKY